MADLFQGTYNSTAPTLQSGQRTDLQFDDRGNLKVTNSVGGSSTSTGEYETVAASQTDQVLGATGAIGDYLEGLIIVVATAATAAVSIKDGAGSAISIFPNNPGGGVGTYPIPIGLSATGAGWKVTTGAGSSVIAVGNFT